MPYQPRPGDIGLSYSDSFIGKIIRIAQALVGDWAVYSHAFIVLDDGYIMEALPQGASVQRLDKYPEGSVVYSQFDLTESQRADICVEALRLEGTPYGWLDFLAIGLHRFVKRDHFLPRFVHRKVQSSGKMICSQLVAEAYRRAGVDLDPHTDPQYVTPGDLAKIIIEGYRKNFPDSS